MRGNIVPPGRMLLQAPPPGPGPAPGPAPVVTWGQVEWVLTRMWCEYESFIYSCNPAFQINRNDPTQPRSVDLRTRVSFRTKKHRGVGKPAAAAGGQLRDSLLEAERRLWANCYQPATQPVHAPDIPPSMPPGCVINPTPPTPNEMDVIANCLQKFRDNMTTAVKLVDAYIKILENDAEKRQRWFDNAIKIVSAVTALGAALAPL